MESGSPGGEGLSSNASAPDVNESLSRRDSRLNTSTLEQLLNVPNIQLNSLDAHILNIQSLLMTKSSDSALDEDKARAFLMIRAIVYLDFQIVLTHNWIDVMIESLSLGTPRLVCAAALSALAAVTGTRHGRRMMQTLQATVVPKTLQVLVHELKYGAESTVVQQVIRVLMHVAANPGTVDSIAQHGGLPLMEAILHQTRIGIAAGPMYKAPDAREKDIFALKSRSSLITNSFAHSQRAAGDQKAWVGPQLGTAAALLTNVLLSMTLTISTRPLLDQSNIPNLVMQLLSVSRRHFGEDASLTIRLTLLGTALKTRLGSEAFVRQLHGHHLRMYRTDSLVEGTAARHESGSMRRGDSACTGEYDFVGFDSIASHAASSFSASSGSGSHPWHRPGDARGEAWTGSFDAGSRSQVSPWSGVALGLTQSPRACGGDGAAASSRSVSSTPRQTTPRSGSITQIQNPTQRSVRSAAAAVLDAEEGDFGRTGPGVFLSRERSPFSPRLNALPAMGKRGGIEADESRMDWLRHKAAWPEQQTRTPQPTEKGTRDGPVSMYSTGTGGGAGAPGLGPNRPPSAIRGSGHAAHPNSGGVPSRPDAGDSGSRPAHLTSGYSFRNLSSNVGVSRVPRTVSRVVFRDTDQSLSPGSPSPVASARSHVSPQFFTPMPEAPLSPAPQLRETSFESMNRGGAGVSFSLTVMNLMKKPAPPADSPPLHRSSFHSSSIRSSGKFMMTTPSSVHGIANQDVDESSMSFGGYKPFGAAGVHKEEPGSNIDVPSLQELSASVRTLKERMVPSLGRGSGSGSGSGSTGGPTKPARPATAAPQNLDPSRVFANRPSTSRA